MQSAQKDYRNQATIAQRVDTCFAGNDRGHAIYRIEAGRCAEVEEAARTQVFFTDADAL